MREVLFATPRFTLQTMVSGAWCATPDQRAHTKVLRTKSGWAAGKARSHEIEASCTSVHLILKHGTRWQVGVDGDSNIGQSRRLVQLRTELDLAA
jgi:hypothetical protein